MSTSPLQATRCTDDHCLGVIALEALATPGSRDREGSFAAGGSLPAQLSALYRCTCGTCADAYGEALAELAEETGATVEELRAARDALPPI
jgi:hypothetical protein